MKKRILSFVLVIAMTLSMVAFASASENYGVTIDGSIKGSASLESFDNLLNFIKTKGVALSGGGYKFTPNSNTSNFTLSVPKVQTEVACNLNSTSGNLDVSATLAINNKLDGNYTYLCTIFYGIKYIIVSGTVPAGYRIGDAVEVTCTGNMSDEEKQTALDLANSALTTIISMFAGSINLISINYASFPQYCMEDFGFDEFVICTTQQHTTTKLFDGPEGIKYSFCDNCFKYLIVETGNNGGGSLSKDHYTATQEGSQIVKSTTSLYSLWKNTTGYLHTRKNGEYVLEPYEIQLVEMYTGDTAFEIVKEYNKYNDDPKDDEQWVLMKFKIKNLGTKAIKASNILGNGDSSDQFYTRDGALVNIIDSATIDGNDIYDEIRPGTTAEIEMGVLIKKSVGFPCIYIQMGFEDYDKVFAKTTTDPEYVFTETEPDNNGGNDVTIADTSKIFKDVKAKGWYKEYVDYSVAYGIFTGTSSNTFSPSNNITRAQFVQVLANLQGVDTTNRNVQTSFSDVPAKKWYTAAVKWASDNKIVNGVGDGKFDPNANVTREQMCVMLVNFAKFKGITLKTVEAKENFADDGKISKWAKTAVYTCQQADIVNGKGAGKFDPQGTGTRAEASVMFTKFHKDYMK